MKYCSKVLLVGLDDELPSDPTVAYEGTPPLIGCNRLFCSACGAVVRHTDSRSTTSNAPPPKADLEKLYESSDPASSPLLDSAPIYKDTRTYFCRCEWAATAIVRFAASLDAPWQCGGHEPRVGPAAPNLGAQVVEARNVRHAEARKATDALIAATVPIFIPETGAKIKLIYTLHVNPTFATASELRDSLLASYPEAAQTGLPLVRINRGEDSAPAWGWINDFLRMRSDWWPAIGIALQHAATDGGEIAQTALVELLAHFSASIAVLPWTAPMAELWPDRRTVNSAATGWGTPDHRLDAVIRDQQKYMVDVRAGDGTVFLDRYGVNGTDIIKPLTNAAELQGLLVETAHAGQSPGGDTGPWSWLAFEFLIGDEWLRPAFVKIVHALDDADEAMIFALLDWFSEEQDLWKFAELLNGWHARPPSWWTTPADTKPTGWKRTMRSAHWPETKTLGDVATEALRRAKWQVVTPPVVDLPQLYGSSIS
jgi:hypothetical protein